MFLTRGAIRNPIMVLMTCIAVTVLSQIALTRLPRDLFPKITIPIILVSATYPGASPEAMEKTVTYPLEQAVTRVAGVTQILSTTRQGLTNIQVRFNWGANLDIAETEVIQNIQRTVQNLPPGVTQQPRHFFSNANVAVGVGDCRRNSATIASSSVTRLPSRRAKSSASGLVTGRRDAVDSGTGESFPVGGSGKPPFGQGSPV